MPHAAWLPDAPWYVLAAVPFVIFAAYTVFGATGFGSSIISVPVLAHWFPLTFAVPVVTTLDCAAVLNASFRQWRRAERRELARLLPTMFAGIALGTTLLVNLPRGPALLALGVFVAAYGIHLLVGRRQWKNARPYWAWPIGLFGGVFSVMFGTGGPIYMIYLAARIDDKTALRATSSLLVTISVLIRTGVFVGTGLLLKAPVLVAAAVLLPLMFAGYYAGNRLHFALSRAGVLKLIAGLLAVNGVSLVVRAVALLKSE
jgi:uncharacterized membrane protein YfcA